MNEPKCIRRRIGPLPIGPPFTTRHSRHARQRRVRPAYFAARPKQYSAFAVRR